MPPGLTTTFINSVHFFHREGSVIAEYTVTASSATSFYNAKITALRKDIYQNIEYYGYTILSEGKNNKL